MTTLSREPAATETRFFCSDSEPVDPQLGAMADDLLPPRDLANAAFAVMVWASSKMSAKERDKLLNGFSIAIRDRVSPLPDGTISPKSLSSSSPKSKQSAVRSTRSAATPPRPSRTRRTERG